MDQKRQKEFMIKEADLLAFLIRLFSIATLGGGLYGLISGYLKLKKLQKELDEIAKNRLEAISDVNPSAISALRMPELGTIYTEEKETLNKEAIEKGDLTGIEQYLYDLLNKYPLLQGTFPFLAIGIPVGIGVSLYSLITTAGLKARIREAKEEARRAKEELYNKLQYKEGQDLIKEGFVKTLFGFALSLGAFIFLLTTPLFYNYLSERTKIKPEDLARKKILLRTLASPLPVQLEKDIKLDVEKDNTKEDAEKG